MRVRVVSAGAELREWLPYSDSSLRRAATAICLLVATSRSTILTSAPGLPRCCFGCKCCMAIRCAHGELTVCAGALRCFADLQTPAVKLILSIVIALNKILPAHCFVAQEISGQL